MRPRAGGAFPGLASQPRQPRVAAMGGFNLRDPSSDAFGTFPPAALPQAALNSQRDSLMAGERGEPRRSVGRLGDPGSCRGKLGGSAGRGVQHRAAPATAPPLGSYLNRVNRNKKIKYKYLATCLLQPEPPQAFTRSEGSGALILSFSHI